MSDANEQKPARMSLWLRLVFGVSLALNLAVAGVVAGAFFRPDHREGSRPHPPLGALLYRELAKEDRKALRRAALGTRSDREDRRIEDAQELAAALRAVPIDVVRINLVLDEQMDYLDAFQASVRAAWLERVSSMNDDERAAYAERLKDAMLKPKGDKPKKKQGN